MELNFPKCDETHDGVLRLFPRKHNLARIS
jgi:hypothetical protein